MLWFTPLCATRSKSERTRSQPKKPEAPLVGARGDPHPDKGRIHPSGCPPVGFVWCCISNDKIAIMFVIDVRCGSNRGAAQDGRTRWSDGCYFAAEQPGTVERDGSRRASLPILAAASPPTGHSGCRAVACDRGARSRRGGHVRRLAGWVLQLRGEILLQIRCRCSETRSPMQFAIAQPDSCGSSRTAVRFTGSGWRCGAIRLGENP
jgi:hypothetical protein